MKYTLETRDEWDAQDACEIEADSDDEATASVPAHVAKWAREGDWGDDGARVGVEWWLYQGGIGDAWNCVAEGEETVEIEPKHEALIRKAVREKYGSYAQDEEDRVLRCDHEWVGVGGCDENPGVWSEGGTAVRIVERCGVCGLRRVRRYTGSQYNPGEHDTVSYSIGARDDEEAPQ
jgi:hypothetical protein